MGPRLLCAAFVQGRGSLAASRPPESDAAQRDAFGFWLRHGQRPWPPPVVVVTRYYDIFPEGGSAKCRVEMVPARWVRDL